MRLHRVGDRNPCLFVGEVWFANKKGLLLSALRFTQPIKLCRSAPWAR